MAFKLARSLFVPSSGHFQYLFFKTRYMDTLDTFSFEFCSAFIFSNKLLRLLGDFPAA